MDAKNQRVKINGNRSVCRVERNKEQSSRRIESSLAEIDVEIV